MAKLKLNLPWLTARSGAHAIMELVTTAPPATFEPIVRPRLIARLAAAARFRVTLLVAGAGFGKSVAVRHFLEQTGVNHVRYAVRREHAGLLGFARGLAEAVEPIAPKAVKSVAAAYERAIKTNSPAQELAAWALAHVKDFDGVIVIDDFHEARDSECAKFLAELVARSTKLRWLIAARETLDLPVASWLAYLYMDRPIDEVDLKLTLDEAEDFCKSADIAVVPEDISELASLTHSWPVAFAFALRASTRTADFKRVASGTREMVYAYLAEQIFQRLSTSERAFLLDTCVFTTVEIPLLAKYGCADPRAIMTDLRRRTSFISDEGNDHYRYHDLFREFLQRELQLRGADALEQRQIAAAAMYHAEQRFSESLALYIRAKKHNYIVETLARAGVALLEVGRLDLIEAALDAVPEFQRRNNSNLLALRAALESAAGRYDRAYACYEAALHLCGDHSLRGEIIQAYALTLARHSEFDRALKLLEEYNPDTATDRKIQARMFGLLAGLYSRSPAKGNVEAMLSRALTLTAAIDDEALRGEILQMANYVAVFQGEYGRAEAHIATIRDLCERNGFDGLAARALTGAYVIAYARGDLSRCLSLLQQIGTYGERAGDKSLVHFALAGTYEIETMRGDTGRLVALEGKLADFDAYAFRSTAESLLPGIALQAAWNGDFETALQTLSGSAEKMQSVAQCAMRWAEIAVYAAAAFDQNSLRLATSNALLQLEVCESSSALVVHHQSLARIWLTLTYLLTGDNPSADSALQQLECEELDANPVTATLACAVRATYGHLVRRATMDEALERLRRADLGGYARLFEALVAARKTEALSPFANLTKAELAVLRALARGETSKEIARGLRRSSLTIDSHVRAIVRKLGCEGRQKAVFLARERGIL